MIKPFKIMLIAGEASGDAHGAEVVKALKRLQPEIDCFGIGGAKMQAAGCTILFDSRVIAVMGLFEVIRHFAKIREAWKIALNALAQRQPDCVILIDYPGFNLRFAQKARQAGMKVLYYVSPQIWAWKKKRIYKIKQVVDYMAVILPFEEDIYKKAGVPVSFVGSPLIEQVRKSGRLDARKALDLLAGDIVVGLLPGSRNNEISRLMPELIDTAQILAKENSHIQFVIPLADTIDASRLERYFEHTMLPVKMIKHNSHLAMAAADILIGCSGTVTLEAAIIGTPMVVVYKMNPLTFEIAKRIVKIAYISLPNILAKQKIFPELIQNEAKSAKIAEVAQKLLDSTEERENISVLLKQVVLQLGIHKAGTKVAEIALQLCTDAKDK